MSRTRLLGSARSFVTDGGLETDLIFHHGVELPDFAAFPLLDDAGGRQLLRDYYQGYARVAESAGAGLLLESPTWRANADWGDRLGYDAAALDRVNRDAIAFLRALADEWRDRVVQTLVVGMIGPRGDGYRSTRIGADEAAGYHLPQVRSLAAGGADLVAAYTLTSVAEAIGLALAADQVGVDVGISFTVETDGRLPDGTTLAAAIEAVDRECRPAHYGINCAHPIHIAGALAEPGAWRERVAVIRVNASRLSHAELDACEQLDDGVPDELATELAGLRRSLSGLRVIGGCCGTDVRHVAAMWGVSAQLATT